MGGPVHQVSDSEWTLMRWVEKILAPLITMAIITGVGFAIKVDSALSQQDGRITQIEGDKVIGAEEVATVKKQQNKLLESTHRLEVDVERLDTSQQHIKEDIAEIKAQNGEILRILRGDR